MFAIRDVEGAAYLSGRIGVMDSGCPRHETRAFVELQRQGLRPTRGEEQGVIVL